MVDEDYFYTLRQVALMYYVSEGTLRYHIRKKHLAPIKAFHNGKIKYIFTLTDLKRLKQYLMKEIGDL